MGKVNLSPEGGNFSEVGKEEEGTLVFLWTGPRYPINSSLYRILMVILHRKGDSGMQPGRSFHGVSAPPHLTWLRWCGTPSPRMLLPQ